MEPNVLMAGAVMLGFASVLFLLGTAFAKISIVFMILRIAMGLQQTPSNAILFSLAIIVSLFITMPIINDTYELAQQNTLNIETIDDLLVSTQNISGPFTSFLKNNTDDDAVEVVTSIASQLWEGHNLDVSVDNFFLLLTSFVLTELTKAFQIGFLLFLPFIAIDLVVTTVLMALGMMMVSPTIISTPFKLLLFVMVSGWSKLFNGLALGYII